MITLGPSWRKIVNPWLFMWLKGLTSCNNFQQLIVLSVSFLNAEPNPWICLYNAFFYFPAVNHHRESHHSSVFQTGGPWTSGQLEGLWTGKGTPGGWSSFACIGVVLEQLGGWVDGVLGMSGNWAPWLLTPYSTQFYRVYMNPWKLLISASVFKTHRGHDLSSKI